MVKGLLLLVRTVDASWVGVPVERVENVYSIGDVSVIRWSSGMSNTFHDVETPEEVPDIIERINTLVVSPEKHDSWEVNSKSLLSGL